MSNKIIDKIFGRYPLFEEDGNDNNTNTKNNTNSSQQSNTEKTNNTADNPNAAQIEELRNKIISMKSALQRKLDTIEREKINVNSQVAMMNQQLVKLGAAPVQMTAESSKFIFSKKLYESVATSKADELEGVIKATFDNLDNLSYYLDDKSCKTFARRLLAWINNEGWNDGENHWDDIDEHLRQILSGGSISMSRREINAFIEEFNNNLQHNTLFTWIFGNKNNKFTRR